VNRRIPRSVDWPEQALQKRKSRAVVVWREVPWLEPRQLEAVGLLSMGKTPKEAAAHMGITHGTIKVMLARARVRAGVRTTPQLVAEFVFRLMTAADKGGG